MSVQFRSRVKSTIDYSVILNGKGTCCNQDGTKSEKSFYDCFNDGGNYYPGITSEVNCPAANTEKGCCCACSFVDNLNNLPYPWNFNTNQPASGTPYLDSGVICDIPRCECERIGGKFTPSTETTVTLTSENWQNLCLKDVSAIFGENKQIDARYPRSCCSIGIDPVSGWMTGVTCENVCYPSECASSGTLNNPAVFSNDEVCTQFLYSIDGISNGRAVCSNGLKLSQMTEKNNSYKDIQFGSCYELVLSDTTKLYEYECNIKIKSDCSGYWVKSDSDVTFCNDKYTPSNPTKVNNKYQPQIMTESSFSDLKLQPGMKYQGGIYLGVFEAGSPVNSKGSKLYGDMNFNNASDYYAYNIGVGGHYKKWALILDQTTYNLSFLTENENDVYVETSLWDGYYNTYGNMSTFDGVTNNLMNTLKYRPKHGFIDFYLPSIQELHFYANFIKTNSNFIKSNGIFMSSTLFTTKHINTSTNRTKINNNSMVYGMILSEDDLNFKTILVPKNKFTSVMFFRKIIIE